MANMIDYKHLALTSSEIPCRGTSSGWFITTPNHGSLIRNHRQMTIVTADSIDA